MNPESMTAELQGNIEALVKLALFEDLGVRGDITGNAIIDESETTTIYIVSRQSGVVSGLDVASIVFQLVDPALNVEWVVAEGDNCKPSEKLGQVTGKLRSILSAERTCLNFLQHLCGVSTLTKRYVDVLEEIGSTTKIRDTRKTLPGYRFLEKKAVRAGGGVNHRMGLYDSFLVKDNHLAGAEIEEVILNCREFDSDVPLEIEVDNLDQLQIVLSSKPDLILLDNFSVEDVLRAQELAPNVDFELSGGVNLENLKAYGSTNVKYIAVGAITHSASALDIGFDLP